MMTRFLIFTVFVFLSILFWSCDKIDTPIEVGADEALMDTIIADDISLNYEQLEILGWDTVASPNNRSSQFVLLEEYTGHTCANCPPGTKELLRLDSIIKEQLVPLTIHLGGFAVPQDNPDGSFKTDHRVPEMVKGNYLQKMNVPGFPMGSVQRSGEILIYPKWETEIQNYLNQTPKAEVSIKNLYNSQQGIIRTIVEYEWLENMSGSYNIQVFLKEDHIKDWQINIDYNEPNYDHRHVLQKVVNKLFGVPAKEADAGVKGRKEYIYRADSDWDINNTAVIAFLYKSTPPYNVVQVNEAAVVE